MIPLRLELTNFLAYKNPAPLNFMGIHVAVLVGENGAGKSSLLDAMTWALWGKARAKTDAELVHQGQTEMRVEFTFALRDQTYRVIRAKRVKGGGGVLELQALTPEGRWNPIPEATIPKTQKKIDDLLRINYDTFINSAYLMQGRADEFTGKKPTERKQILADILGLKEWEQYEERAKKRANALSMEVTGLEGALKEMQAELGQRETYEAELREAQTLQIEVSERLRQAEAGWREIDLARQAMIALEKQIDDLSRRVRDGLAEVTQIESELKEAQSRADVVTLGREIEATNNLLARLEALEAEQAETTLRLNQSRERAAQARGQNEALEAEANGLKKQIDNARADLAQAKRRATDAAQMDADKLSQRRLTLQTATDPRCPTCGQPLTDAARDQLLAELAQEIEARHAQLQVELNELDTARAQNVAELETAVEARRAQYRANQAELKTANDEQTRLEKTLKQMGDDLREKSTWIKKLAELQTALTQADEAKQRIANLVERRERWQASLEADRTQQARLDAEARKYELVLRDSAVRQTALDKLRQEDTLAKTRRGAAEQKLAALEGLQKLQAQKQAEQRRLEDEQALYEELREAFGKKGVPAMMIEAAVPEIEAATNALLGRMTSGRMTVRLNTQKENQAGEVRETLEIQIADELGTRAYELYSGGEAFRVNFAIRVALSQLLARRAGTQLQTLIVDEGFGALDATGRERLVEAINATQHDFERILVVTHIDELKDAFPARIEITKGANGSEIMVV